MAFWNRKRDDNCISPSSANLLTRAVADARKDIENLRREVDQLHNRVNGQPVPTNGKPQAGSAVQDWLPIVDRMQELLLVQMGNADLAQAFGTYARQRESRASEEQPNTAWTEPDESSYENI